MKLALLLPFVLASACGGTGLGIIEHVDQGGGDTPPDLTTDGTPRDMAMPPERDGGTWTDVSYTGYLDGGSLAGVWSSDGGTVIAVGDYAKILRSQEGGAFVQDPSTEPAMPGLTAISGAAGADLFVVGTGGAAWKYGGTDLTAASVWNPDAPGVSDYLWAVSVPIDGVAFAGGDGVILERVASMSYNWTPLANGPDSTQFETALGIWAVLTGPSQYDAFAVGCVIDQTTGFCTSPRIWHYSGGTVTTESAPAGLAGLFGVWGSGTTDIYAAADAGTIIHSTGNGVWTKQTTPVQGTGGPAILAISGSGPDEVYATGFSDSNGTLLLHKLDHMSTQWTRDEEVVVPGKGRSFYGLSVTPSAVYMVGDSGAILHK